MTILKHGTPITNDSGKNIDFKQAFDMFGLGGILKMLQTNEPNLVLGDLSVSETTQSAIDGQGKLQRLGIADNPELREEYLDIVKLGQEAETLMADFLKTNKINKTYQGKTYDIVTDCGFYVGNPEYANETSIPKKATVLN